jgi:hypothetical protein
MGGGVVHRTARERTVQQFPEGRHLARIPARPSCHRESNGPHDHNAAPRVHRPIGPMVPFEDFHHCTCSFVSQSGTVSIELHGTTTHGRTNGTIIVESVGPILPTPVDRRHRPAVERSPFNWTGVCASSRISRSSGRPAIAACPCPSPMVPERERAVDEVEPYIVHGGDLTGWHSVGTRPPRRVLAGHGAFPCGAK